MKRTVGRTVALFLVLGLSPSPAVEPAEVAARLREMPAAHPRLFLSDVELPALRQRTELDPVWRRFRDGVIAKADAMLATGPVERVLIGRRLLDKSRTCLERVLNLGLAWRLTGERRYFERARTELLAVAGFEDWNPVHFLDTAEMSHAVGLGYDWFWPALSEDDRAHLRAALITKGLEVSVTRRSWFAGVNNWNQVCNGGVTVGALALAESEPELAAKIIARAVNVVPNAMREYAPDGAYPEGPSYWGYGTTYNVILIDALLTALGTDFGLSQQPGFLATADYQLHVFGPTGLAFNYSDSARGDESVLPAMFWLASARRAPQLLWSEWAKLDDPRFTATGWHNDLIFPLLMLWTSPDLRRPDRPPVLSWTGHGMTPVACHRSSWEPDATYVAIKGGTPTAGHAHMDIGSFVMEADGERWADDLGRQEYNSLESRGIDPWGKAQDAQRWKIFRLGPAAHNVLMVDGRPQRVEGRSPIVVGKPNRTVVQLDPTYEGQLRQARRGAELRADRTVLVQDEVTALDQPAAIRWAMVTPADVRVDGPGRATLTQHGKTLRLRVIEPAGATLKIYPTDPPPADYDAPNPGTRMIGFEISVPAAQSRRLMVHLVPGSSQPTSVALQPLAEW